MDRRERKTRILVVVLGVVLYAGVLIGCTSDSEEPEGQDPAGSELSDTREGTEGGGEHASGSEGSGEGANPVVNTGPARTAVNTAQATVNTA